ncbi:MAG: dTDP-glucose 4,6-dehydratase [Bdellovibrionales bacterium]|nr:dTDP-glucose 4,6-dehydratase [Bdellovibrionales bacterium]
MKSLLVTGAAGFIGSNFAEIALDRGYKVIAYDALTYAGHRENLQDQDGSNNFHFVHGKIQDRKAVLDLLREHKICGLVNFAAESHVDKSITGPADFIETNISGTFHLLTAAKEYFDALSDDAKKNFRFLHVSTDEVFGSLGATGKFTETTPYAPNSPYSASKAASDLLVRAWHHTYGLPTITTNCSNNYGPKQFPEKLIPHMIFCALQGKALPVYGKGENVRDWIHVTDHASGVLLALEKGRSGETYCFGGNSERKNIDVVKEIASILDGLRPRKDGKKYSEQIEFVMDRPGHDLRYAIDDSKAENELGFKRNYAQFEDGLRATVEWYLDNVDWSQKVTSKPGTKVTYDWASLK